MPKWAKSPTDMQNPRTTTQAGSLACKPRACDRAWLPKPCRRLRSWSRLSRAQQCGIPRLRTREKSGHDAVPSVSACDQRLDRVPINTVAQREPLRHSTSELPQMRRDRLCLRRRTLYRNDIGKLAQPADQLGAEPKVCRAGVVIDAQGEPAFACDSGEVLVYLIIG